MGGCFGLVNLGFLVFEFKKKKKINKFMLIYVYLEIFNMFILKGKLYFFGVVFF